MEILKVVKANRDLSQGRGAQTRKKLVLIIYDTVWAHRIRERWDPLLVEGNPAGVIEVRGKYALALTYPDDTNMIGQCYAMRGYAPQAEWAHGWDDLPAAMERLRARHANEPFPEEIDYVIDWPDYTYWQHMKKSVSSPERKKSIQAFLEEAGRS